MAVPRTPSPETDATTLLYESDFFAWANEQASLQRAGKLSGADRGNREHGQKREARSGQQAGHPAAAVAQMAVPARPARKRLALQIKLERRDVPRHVADNPSLSAQLPAVLGDSYTSALLLAAGETGLSEALFPAACN
jgi:Domain of unknown function DUF29